MTDEIEKIYTEKQLKRLLRELFDHYNDKYEYSDHVALAVIEETAERLGIELYD